MAQVKLKNLLTKLTVRGVDYPVSTHNIVTIPDQYLAEVLQGQPGAQQVTGDAIQSAAPRVMTDGRNHR